MVMMEKDLTLEEIEALQAEPPVWELFGLSHDSTLKIGWDIIQEAPAEVRQRFVGALKELLSYQDQGEPR
jgi:hypothetical protein